MVDHSHEMGAAMIREVMESGASSADIFLKQSDSREISFPDRSETRSSERGLALRVFLADGRSSFSAVTLGDNDAPVPGDGFLSRLATHAVASASASTAASLPSLPSGEAPAGRGLGLLDPDVESLAEPFLEAADQIHTMAVEVCGEGEARLILQGVTSTVQLCNSSGFSGSYRHTLARMDLTLTRGANGHSQATRAVRASRSLRGLAADGAASEAVAILDQRMAPRILPSGIYKVVLAPAAAAELVAALAGCLSGSGNSIKQDGLLNISSRIASDAVTLTDDGRLPGGIASSPFDGEGSRTQRTVLVHRGVVQNRLRNLLSGSTGNGSTGNGIRLSFRDVPTLRPTNLFINPGNDTPGDLLGSIREGIRITTLGRIPTLSNLETRFSVPFSGRWVHNGSLGAPLQGGYLTGNLKELLLDIAAAGSDLYFSQRRGSFGAPSLLLNRATIRST
jgi:PmbA protein